MRVIIFFPFVKYAKDMIRFALKYQIKITNPDNLKKNSFNKMCKLSKEMLQDE